MSEKLSRSPIAYLKKMCYTYCINAEKGYGIISHVDELKQRIERQIVVRKSKTGGSRAEIII